MRLPLMAISPQHFFPALSRVLNWRLALIIGAVWVGSAPGYAQENTLSIHSQLSKKPVAEIAATTAYRLVERQGAWQLIRFNEPSVPVWVSSDYVTEQSGRATVSANGLKLRNKPSLGSIVLAAVPRGYQSQVLAKESGFTQIYAPTWLKFAIASSESVDPAGTVSPSLNSASAVQTSSAWRTDVGSQTPGSKPINLPVDPPASTVQSESTTQTPKSSAPVISDAPVDIKDEVIAEESLSQNSTPVNQEPILPEAQQHRLAPGDTIALTVFGEQDLSAGNVRIPQSGSVSFPLIGAYQVTGKTVSEVEDMLRKVLEQGYVRNPQLNVAIVSYRPIFVLGAARSIGSFPYSEGLTIAKAIAIAGGAKPSAKTDGVSLLRDGQVVQEGLAIDSQLRILSGDIISIDEAAEKANSNVTSYVYLHGEVRSPGEYEFRGGLTVEKAVVLAGGFTLRASRRRISVSRIEEGEEEPKKMRRVKLHMPIKPGDIIDVGASWL